jgi:DNA-binding transcriptional regulator YiaG
MRAHHNQGPQPPKSKAEMTCPTCRAPLRERKLDRYQYRESGLNNVVLRGGVSEAICPNGHERLVAVQGEPQLLQVITLALLMRRGFLHGKEIRYARETCDLTQAALAKAMGMSRRETIAEWESERSPRRDLASEFLLRAVLLGEFKEALEGRVPNYLSPSHFDLLHTFRDAFSEAYKRLLLSVRTKEEEEIQVRRTEKGVWTPDRLAA